MRITFIGTSHGVPEPNRKCSCTLLEIGTKKYLIDAGTDPIPELINRGIHPNEINAVFITHNHSDHTAGLVPFVDLCSWFYTDTDPLIHLPEMELLDGLKAWRKALHGEIRKELRFAEIKEGLIYDDGTLRVTALKTGHIPNAYAFSLEAEGKHVLFTGDMKHGDGPTADYARYTAETKYDLVVCECAHFDAMQYLEPIRKNPPKRFFFSHYSWRYVESCHHLRVLLEGEVPVVLLTDNYEATL